MCVRSVTSGSPTAAWTSHRTGGDLEFWDEVERRVKLAEAEARGEGEQPSEP